MNYRKLLKDFSIAVASQGVSAALSIATMLFIPKVLGDFQFAYWQLFLFYSSYVGFFHFGLNDGVYLLHGGRNRGQIDKSDIKSQFEVCAVSQVIFAACLMMLAFVVPMESERALAVVLTGVYLVLTNVSAYVGYVFQAMNETSRYSLATIYERLAFALPLLLLMVAGESRFEFYVFAYIGSKVVNLAYCLIHFSDFLGVSSLPITKALTHSAASVKVGFNLMIANLASTLVLGVARQLVDMAWGIEAFSSLSLAISLANFFSIFVAQAGMVLFPSLRQSAPVERAVFYELMRDSISLLLPISYCLSIPLVAFLSWWLPSYSASLSFVAMLVPLCVFDCKMSVVDATMLKVIRAEKTLLFLNTGAVGLSAVLTLLSVIMTNDLNFVVYSVVISVVCRSFVSELLLDRMLGVGRGPLFYQEIILMLLYLLAIRVLDGAAASFVCIALYGLYILVNKSLASSCVKKMIGAARGN